MCVINIKNYETFSSTVFENTSLNDCPTASYVKDGSMKTRKQPVFHRHAEHQTAIGTNGSHWSSSSEVTEGLRGRRPQPAKVWNLLT